MNVKDEVIIGKLPQTSCLHAVEIAMYVSVVIMMKNDEHQSDPKNS